MKRVYTLNKFSKKDGRQLFWTHQWEFLKDYKTREIALVCGYGAGKTYALCSKAFFHLVNNKLKNENQSHGWIVYRTLKDAKSIFTKEFSKYLDRLGVLYKYNKAEYTFYTDYGTLELKSMEDPSRLVGSNLSFIGMDEFDTEETDKALEVYNKLIARLRGSNTPQLFITTTPEGYRATYNLFVEKYDPSIRKLIQGKTTDNKALDKNYIDSLKYQYDEKRLLAYLNGEFVNFKGDTVYDYFDREKHIAKEKIELDPSLTVHLCFDFNVNPYCVAICQHKSFYNKNLRGYEVKEGDIMVIDEIVLNKGKSSTYDMVEAIKQRIPRNFRLCFSGDASGFSMKTSGGQSDWWQISQGLSPYYQFEAPICNSRGEIALSSTITKSNPPINQRVNAVNFHLRKNHIVINKHCKWLQDDFEQVVFNEKGKLDDSNKLRTHMSDAFGYYIDGFFSLKSLSRTVKY